MKTIGVDLDDVLLDFNANICAFYNSKFGTDFVRDDVNEFHLDLVWGCSRDEAVQIIADFYESDLHWSSAPIIGAYDALEELRKENEIVLITAKPDYLKDKTITWLDKHYPGIFSDLRFNNQYHGNGVKRSKREVCDELGVDVFVDDSLLNVNDVVIPGRKVFLLDSPWNQGTVADGVKRVFSWQEIPGLI